MAAVASDYTLEDQRRMAKAKNYFAWQARMVTKRLGRRVVEVGCGIGNFTANLLDREAVIAVDIDAACVDALLERYPNQSNLQAITCDAASAEFRELVRFRPDSCVCLNALEHVEDDLGALRAMAAILPAGGVVVLIAPAFPALFGPIDRNLGHFRRHTRSSVRCLAHDAGFRIMEMNYLNFPGFFGWWLNAHVFKREAQSELQVEIFDRLLVPLISRIERFISPPFGQSIFVVLEKAV